MFPRLISVVKQDKAVKCRFIGAHKLEIERHRVTWTSEKGVQRFSYDDPIQDALIFKETLVVVFRDRLRVFINGDGYWLSFNSEGGFLGQSCAYFAWMGRILEFKDPLEEAKEVGKFSGMLMSVLEVNGQLFVVTEECDIVRVYCRKLLMETPGAYVHSCAYSNGVVCVQIGTHVHRFTSLGKKLASIDGVCSAIALNCTRSEVNDLVLLQMDGTIALYRDTDVYFSIACKGLSRLSHPSGFGCWAHKGKDVLHVSFDIRAIDDIVAKSLDALDDTEVLRNFYLSRASSTESEMDCLFQTLMKRDRFQLLEHLEKLHLLYLELRCFAIFDLDKLLFLLVTIANGVGSKEYVWFYLTEKPSLIKHVQTLPDTPGSIAMIPEKESKCKFDLPKNRCELIKYSYAMRCDLEEQFKDRSVSQELIPMLCNTRNVEKLNTVNVFKHDLRVSEVEKLLQYNKVRKMKLTEQQKQQLQSEDFNYQPLLFNHLNTRNFARLFGYEMIYFSSQSIETRQQLIIDEIIKKGKTESGSLTVDQTSASQLNQCRFDAGVCRALQIHKDASIDSAWIVFNRPAEPNTEHAGFLLGLGLNGHLRKLAPFHAFEYLNVKNEMTTIGLLLGLSCSYAGTRDEKINKMIRVHIPSCLPADSTDLLLSTSVQTSALLSIGILYMKSLDRKLIDAMLDELSKIDLLDSHQLAAGFSLGFIMLESYPNFRNQAVIDRLHNFTTGFHQTASSALIALSFLYLRSNDHMIAAEYFKLPSTLSLFDQIQPDRLQLIILCRSLVMFDAIQPTAEFVHTNIPNYLKDSSGNLASSFYLQAGSCFAIALKYCGTFSSQAYATIESILKSILPHTKLSGMTSYKKKMVSLAARNCVNSLALCLSLVMAGSGNLTALRLLRKLVKLPQFDCYQSQLALNMALGLLFLGKGRFSLSTEGDKLAFVFCAFCPFFGSASNDLRCQLQAFRHLWVKAVEYRLVQCVTETGDLVNANILLNESKILETPCLLPRLDTVSRIRVENDNKFFPLDMCFPESIELLKQNNCVLTLKKRSEGKVNCKDLTCVHRMQANMVFRSQDRFLKLKDYLKWLNSVSRRGEGSTYCCWNDAMKAYEEATEHVIPADCKEWLDALSESFQTFQDKAAADEVGYSKFMKAICLLNLGDVPLALLVSTHQTLRNNGTADLSHLNSLMFTQELE